jgi:hypothetical protein
MSKSESVAAREAKWGEKMIEIRVRFWTDELSDPGQILPKHAHTSGIVRMTTNKSHGINGGKPRPFNSLLDLGAVIEKVLRENKIKLHVSRGMKPYLTT